MRQLSESEEKHLRLESETADLGKPQWDENQTVLAAAVHTLDRDAGSLEGVAAGSWSLGLWRNPRVRAAVDCGETDLGEVREETVVEMPVEERQEAMEARQYC